MIKLIVGLGNPGQNYQKTRHNAGFLFLDSLAEDCSCLWTNSVPFQGLVSECQVGREKVHLLKPQTYMNRSGQSVGQMARYFKLVPEQILVVHDELDFPAGDLKLKLNGGHAGHNGLRDIIAHLGSPGFYRMRIGVGRPDPKMATADYVLSRPPQQDEELIRFAIAKGKIHIANMVSGEMASVMNSINSKLAEKNSGGMK